MPMPIDTTLPRFRTGIIGSKRMAEAFALADTPSQRITRWRRRPGGTLDVR